MTLLAFTSFDYAVLVGYLLLMIAIGAWFSRQQHTSQDFFLAGRKMSWFPVGLSIMATLVSALSYTGAPAEASQVGLKLCIWPLTLWLTLPIVLWIVLPLYRNLEIYSIYEYLELRFDAKTHVIGSVVFIFWRMIWLGGVVTNTTGFIGLLGGSVGTVKITGEGSEWNNSELLAVGYEGEGTLNIEDGGVVLMICVGCFRFRL